MSKWYVMCSLYEQGFGSIFDLTISCSLEKSILIFSYTSGSAKMSGIMSEFCYKVAKATGLDASYAQSNCVVYNFSPEMIVYIALSQNKYETLQNLFPDLFDVKMYARLLSSIDKILQIYNGEFIEVQ